MVNSSCYTFHIGSGVTVQIGGGGGGLNLYFIHVPFGHTNCE